MNINEAQIKFNEARAEVFRAISAVEDAKAKRAKAIASHAVGDTSYKLDVADNAIQTAQRKLEIAEVAAENAQRDLEEARATVEAAETERLRQEWKLLQALVNQAADDVEEHLKAAHDAAKVHADAMRVVASFHQQHAGRLRLGILGQPSDFSIDMTTHGFAHQRTRLVRVPRFAA